ncbi:MAG: hypothetical protein AB1894_28215 [Chloroflexota bacterium]
MDAKPPSPVSECEICSQLDEVETAFYKYGWDDLDRPLPEAAGRLVPIEGISTYEKENDHIRRYPLCGLYYHYRCTYEYLVNGSEDEVTLTRLTPAQSRLLLAPGEYERLIDDHTRLLLHPAAQTRSADQQPGRHLVQVIPHRVHHQDERRHQRRTPSFFSLTKRLQATKIELTYLK